MAEVDDPDARQRVAPEDEHAILSAQDVEVLARFVADGRSRQRPAQGDGRFELAGFEPNQEQLAARKYLGELVAQEQRRIGDRLFQGQSPLEPASPGVKTDELVISRVEGEDRGVARYGLGRKRCGDTERNMPERSPGRAIEPVGEAIGLGVNDGFDGQ